jgi:hypothetical protein
VETAYILALFCNDSLWDRVADIASRSAQDAGLEMDVNKQVKNIKKTTVTMTTTTMKNSDGTSFAKTSSNDDENDNDDVVVDVVPEPVHPKSDTPCDVPLGVGLHALAFILSLALRKFYVWLHTVSHGIFVHSTLTILPSVPRLCDRTNVHATI